MKQKYFAVSGREFYLEPDGTWQASFHDFRIIVKASPELPHAPISRQPRPWHAEYSGLLAKIRMLRGDGQALRFATAEAAATRAVEHWRAEIEDSDRLEAEDSDRERAEFEREHRIGTRDVL